MSTLSKACCTIPPVVTSGYEAKGTYSEIGGLKTYVTGKKDAKRGVIHIYDAFGVGDQILQGADRLAAMLDGIVLMPDFFKGPGLPVTLFDMPEEQRKTTISEFLSGPAAMPKCQTALLKDVAPDAKSKFPSVQAWGTFGLCWGGKMVALASGEGTPFSASGQAHPGGMDRADAERMTIPHVCLASKDEPADVVKEYAEVLGPREGLVETYANMRHGWMGGRCDFEDKENAKEFERGYNQAADFFAKHL